MLLKLEKSIFYLLIFLAPLQLRHIFFFLGEKFSEWQSIHIYATDILVIFILSLWLWRSRKNFSFKFDGIEKSLVVFSFFCALSLFMAQNLQIGFFGLAKILEMSALFLYIKRNFEKIYGIDFFWFAFAGGALLQSIAAIGQFFKQGSLGLNFLAESPIGPNLPGVAKIAVNGERIIRAYGTVPHPNILAAIISTAIFGLLFLLIERWLKSKKTEKALAAVVFIFLALGLSLTFSRVIIILTLIFLVLWLCFCFREKKYRAGALWAGVLAILIFAAILISFSPYFLSRFSPQNLGESQPVVLRLAYGEIALDMIKNRFFLGVGQSNFTILSRDYLTMLAPWVFQPVHNIYLLIAAETGILGLASFLTFLFFIFKKAWEKIKSLAGGERIYLYSFLFIAYNFLFIGLFDHFLWDLQQGQLLFWMILGIIAGLSAHSSTDRAQASEA
ncbi:MAG: O-antigen ligase-related protein [Parcubacteria group bacterium GW2011_GWB1_42_6]|nr:MAG: O-antigen ligase-related protein [Parcubacteria group bacterium GW2011_GWB1_42_6]